MSQHVACTYCGLLIGTIIRYRDGRTIKLGLHWDHWYPVSKGGKDGDTILSCSACNLRKHAKIFDTLIRAKQYLKECWMNLIDEIEYYESPLLDHDQIVLNVPIRSKTYEEAVCINSLPELQKREDNAPSKSDILQRFVQSTGFNGKEETISISRSTTGQTQPKVVKPKPVIVIPPDAEEFIKSWPINKLLPYKELYQKYEPAEVEALVRLRMEYIKESRK